MIFLPVSKSVSHSFYHAYSYWLQIIRISNTMQTLIDHIFLPENDWTQMIVVYENVVLFYRISTYNNAYLYARNKSPTQIIENWFHK